MNQSSNLIKGRISRFVKMALIAACITIHWKSEEPPSHAVWLRELSSYVPVEKIMYNLEEKNK